MDMMQILQQRAAENGRQVGASAPEPKQPPSIADVAVGGADPQNIDELPAATPTPIDDTPIDTLKINAPESDAVNELAASVEAQTRLVVQSDQKKARSAGTKASKDAVAQILASAVHNQGLDAGISAATWWMERFGK